MNLNNINIAEHEFTGEELGDLLLQSVRQAKNGEVGKVHRVAVSPALEARQKTGYSQTAFAELLGISVRTLQSWEQGKRQPTGAAATLLKIAKQHPEVLRSLAI